MSGGEATAVNWAEKAARARQVLDELRSPEAREARRWHRTQQLGHELVLTYLDADTALMALGLAREHKRGDGSVQDASWLYRLDVLQEDAHTEKVVEKLPRDAATRTGRIYELLEGRGALVRPPAPETPREGREMGAMLAWARRRKAHDSPDGWRARNALRMEQLGAAAVAGQPRWYRAALYELLAEHERLDLYDPQLLADDAEGDDLAAALAATLSRLAHWRRFLPQKLHEKQTTNDHARRVALSTLTVGQVVQGKNVDFRGETPLRDLWRHEWESAYREEDADGQAAMLAAVTALVEPYYALREWVDGGSIVLVPQNDGFVDTMGDDAGRG